jgi:DNA modification methylase
MKQTIELHKRWKADPSKGEVFTPNELVREMLDKIPTSVWENPESIFLDPCMGKGTFLIEIITRLIDIYGYSQEDAVSRVYGYDTCVKYVNHLKRGGLVNVFHKDFLSEKLNMKFDVVVGNPPYQENSEKGKSKGGGKNVMRGYALFVEKSMECLKENGNLFYIIPQGWQVSTHALWKLITSKYSLNYIDNNNQKLQDFFGNVGSTFCVINVKNEGYLGKTKIEGYGDINLKKIPTLSDSSNITLFEKTINTFLTEGVSKLNFVGDSTFHYQKKTSSKNTSCRRKASTARLHPVLAARRWPSRWPGALQA